MRALRIAFLPSVTGTELQLRERFLRMKPSFLSTMLAFGLVGLGRSVEGFSDPVAVASADVTSLPPVIVAENRLESFGFDVIVESSPTPHYPYVTEVMPNTAAAKAGLRPGDRILKSDGKSAGVTIFTVGNWYPRDEGGGRTTRAVKKAEAGAMAGERSIIWTLEVETNGVKGPRTLKLVLPTAPPRWGAAQWQPPEGRPPARVKEPGPLAERCREVLENGIWSYPDENLGARLLVTERDPARFHLLGYMWRIKVANVIHRIFMTQQRGRTEVLLSKFDHSEISFISHHRRACLRNQPNWAGRRPKTKIPRRRVRARDSRARWISG